MGLAHAELELINGDDLALARKHFIGEEEIKHIKITVLVDTGSYMLENSPFFVYQEAYKK